jgi:hypothetical protein
VPRFFWLAIAHASTFFVVASVAFSASTASPAIGIAKLVRSAGLAYEIPPSSNSPSRRT